MRFAALWTLLAASAAFAADDPALCRPCHSTLVDAYLATPMGRSFFLPSAQTMTAEEWPANFYHQPSDRHYEMFRRGEGYFIRRYRLDSRGRRVETVERRITHVMGSGERARSYLHRGDDGRTIELPVGWYSQGAGWAMAPGYDRPDHPGFTRRVTHKCMFCHNGYPGVPPEQSRPGRDDDPRFPADLPLGIDCSRCHGPGAEHAATGRPEAIVNPAKLAPERSLEVCLQCHYETTTFRLPESLRRFERSFYDFRPGEPLADYILHFDHAKGSAWDEKFEIVSAGYRLLQSRCFEASGGAMTCLDCHNPHARPDSGARAAVYRARCLRCHEAARLPRGHDAEADDCAACHMPLRRTEDVVHVVMTDHKIVRRPPPGDLLAPRREKTDAEQAYRGEVVPAYPRSLEAVPRGELYWAIAQVKERANLAAGAAALAAALDREDTPFAQPYFELAEALVALGRPAEAERRYRAALVRDPASVQTYNNLANLLADGGRYAEAEDLYRLALSVDPLAADVEVNRGLALRQAERPAEAQAAFERAARANPFLAAAHAGLGALLLEWGEFDRARLALETALAIDPGARDARRNYGLLLRALGDEAGAAEQLTQAGAR